MATKMQFDLVSPERRLASVMVEAVQIPGADGDMTAMADHAPLITTLRPGIVRLDGVEGAAEKAYFVTGGFADVAGPKVTLLAEQAMPVSEVTAEIMDGLIAEARAAQDKARNATDGGTGVDTAGKLVADLEAARASTLG
ncbi:F0F1 ATP synthase subunit epsilon [Roseicyclus mahoneyensis]|uniref:ATP synthase epsilon chain n=1 Tax=Roseicyclus mahoneyensis TaxID=164332 RepID=A0A316GH47_9RHOB|nr:F0F1 ATP synthase subunit epsilon [Roseicyclus mahoneyensis]PWK59497.1 ATP synthase F1 subcomplex epsilon subunit [Roseicyclus mahoneyensis]